LGEWLRANDATTAKMLLLRTRHTATTRNLTSK